MALTVVETHKSWGRPIELVIQVDKQVTAVHT